ncbi:MAG TPA: fluoride efflux transporter CrcB [Kofleriaceae bacterium]|jgi:CrcB protein|nr:fluoride efflux transporter CrcB [Kofleriaceae bacterium]
MIRLLVVCLSGAIGAGVRYLVGLWAAGRLGTAFPYGTLCVNLAGCFLIGLIMQLSIELTNFPPTLRLALTTGFLGGLTTYSSFNYETLALAGNGATRLALLNLGVTVGGCAIAGVLGLLLGRWLVG